MESNLPLVSAVITTYNRAKDVLQAVNSVLNQTYNNIEIIVVDDGSTDNTREALLPYKDKIRYLYKENGGVASSKNFGVKNARGNYIAFLDSDDIWYAQKIEKQISKLKEKPDCDIAISEADYFYKNNLRFPSAKLRKTIRKDGDILEYLVQNPHVGIGSTVLVQKRVFALAGLFDESLRTAQDQDWFYRACSKFKVTLVDEPLVKIIVTTNSNSKSVFSKNSLTALANFERFAPDFTKTHRGLLLKAKSRIHLRYAEDLLWFRNITEARAQIMESMRSYFSIKASILYIKSIVIQICSLVFPAFRARRD